MIVIIDPTEILSTIIDCHQIDNNQNDGGAITLADKNIKHVLTYTDAGR